MEMTEQVAQLKVNIRLRLLLLLLRLFPARASLLPLKAVTP